QRIGLNLIRSELLRHVAKAVVAGRPAALRRESRHLAVIDHDRHPVIVDARLRPFPDDLVELRIAVDLPLVPVIAQVLMLSSGIWLLRLPLEAEIEIG